jgi:hypothetical protein
VPPVESLLLALLALLSLGGSQPAGTGAPDRGTGMPPATVHEEPPPGATGAVKPGAVFVVGDSLAVGAREPLEAALPGWRVETSAETGRHTSEGVAEITGAGSLPDVVVVSLGTNDDPSAADTFAGYVQTVLGAVGPGGCVVWPNIVRPPYNGVSYDGYNRALARLSAANPNLLVVDWVGMVGSNPAWLASDGVHATPTGYQARGQAIAQAVQGCTGAGGGLGLGD